MPKSCEQKKLRRRLCFYCFLFTKKQRNKKLKSPEALISPSQYFDSVKGLILPYILFDMPLVFIR